MSDIDPLDPPGATWWTRGGFARYANPVAWDEVLSLMESSEPAPNWYKAVEKVGYDLIDREADFEHSDIKLNVGIYSGPLKHRHAFVEINNYEQRIALFFVDERDMDAFFATKYLELRKDMAAIDAGRIQADMRRFFIAFVRHGHGEGTVDADGWYTLDERIKARREAEEQRKRMEAERLRNAAQAKEHWRESPDAS